LLKVVAWKARTTSLQERAGRATADDVQRLQLEKDQMQKQLEASRENHVKTTTVLTEFQRTNGVLLANQQKANEELRRLRDEAQQLQADLTAAEARRKEGEAEAAKKIEPLRRIARKYKTQYDELKTEHDALLAAQPQAAAAAEAAAAAQAGASADAERLRQLEERNTQLAAELEQVCLPN